MNDHEDADNQRKLNTVNHIKTKQGFMAHLIRAQKKETNVIPDERSIGHNGRAYGNSPISKLIPREKISCVTEGQGKDEKKDSEHPIKFARGSVGSRIKHPDHMQEDRYHHPVSTPPV
jgi:hypothetical protein